MIGHLGGGELAHLPPTTSSALAIEQYWEILTEVQHSHVHPHPRTGRAQVETRRGRPASLPGQPPAREL